MIHLHEEASRCLLCENAPCSAACPKADPARAIRAIRFGNVNLARQWLDDVTPDELEAAEKACIHYDRPVRIKEIAKALPLPPMVDRLPSLAIKFCGIPCESPFFLASSAVSTNYEMVSAAFEAGWAGVYYKTICLQEIKEVSPRFDALHVKGTGDIYSFRNMEQLSEHTPQEDFSIIQRLKKNYPKKVVIASIMGKDEKEWTVLARRAEDAGADAVELNFSCPQMRHAGMGSDVGQNPELVLFYTACVKQAVDIPVIPKMTPNITNMSQPAMASFFGGADGISAINTIKSATMAPRAEVDGHRCISGLSGRAVKPIALRFILEIANSLDINRSERFGRSVDLSGIGGIENWRDALEFIQLGCRNVQVCTAVMQYGNRIIEDLKLGLQHYMADRGISRLDDLVGEQLPSFIPVSDMDRETIVFPKFDLDACIGCGRCYISCRDGGHQAIRLDENRRPSLDGSKCVGCHLCRLVCPVAAIDAAKRIPLSSLKRR